MARVGSNEPKPAKDGSGEPLVDFMADAPPERPYSEAITEQQLAILAAAGIPMVVPGE